MIKGLPEDGDVRNTVLFKEVAPYLKNISINQFIYELMVLIKAVEEERAVGAISLEGFDAPNVDRAFSWRNTPQGSDFWAHLHGDYRRNKVGY